MPTEIGEGRPNRNTSNYLGIIPRLKVNKAITGTVSQTPAEVCLKDLAWTIHVSRSR